MKRIIIPSYVQEETIDESKVEATDVIIAYKDNKIIGIAQVNSSGYWNILTSQSKIVINEVSGERYFTQFIKACESHNIKLYIQ